jgi:hypothetical protein
MTINAQSGVGKIRLFHDFCGVANYVSLTNDTAQVGDFYMGGESFEVATAGAYNLGSDELSGVVQLLTDTTNKDTIFIGTNYAFDVGKMAPIVIEARVRLPDLDAKAVFIGLTDILSQDEQLEDILDYSAATTVSLTASDLCGFWLSSELTEDEMWHCVFKGGTTTGQTDTEEIESGVDAVLGEFQVLRLEVDPNGTARWYIDGVLKQTTTGAVSTSTDLAVCCGVGTNASSATEMDVDYLLVEANRDFNA